MSNTMSDNTITVREFSSRNVDFRVNDDLPLQLRKGKNESGTFEAGVLVKLNLDGNAWSNVEVYCGTSRADADTIDAAIEALTVARDALRKTAVAA